MHLLSIAQDKKLLWKLDLRLIPWLCLLYLISFLDRTNIGNAKLDGLTTSLHITGGQYNACLSIFFVSYALFEPLTNILLKRLRPSVFIPIIMVLWGICMVCMGLTHNFQGMMAARFFLGMAEAGLFPGINYYLSCWYKRSEFGIRAAIFFSAAAVSGSFGGLLAAAIGQMKGIGGKQGWAWIFILEGLATVLVGVASFWMVFDFPDEARFLSDIDRQRVIRRLKADQQSSAEHESFKMEYFWASVKDWKTWLYALIYMGADCPLYAFSLFLPSIVAGLGYTSTKAQLLSVPPYAAAAILTITIGYVRIYPSSAFTFPFFAYSRRALSPSLSPQALLTLFILMFIILDRRSNQTKRSLQHPHLHPRHDRLRHAGRCPKPRRPLRRHLPRRPWHLPLHRQHHRMGLQQHRRRLQTWYHNGFRHRLGQSQWHCQLKHLSGQDSAEVQNGPCHSIGVSDGIFVRREYLDEDTFASGE